ncbi:MAG: oligosaccharide flippase family protein [archaeon]|nr:oligosaccharide flippase family protein [archaeon]
MESTEGVRTLLSDPRVAIPSITMPLAVAILIQNLNSMTDIMWASWLGAAAVGGLGLAYPLYASVCGVGSGLAVGASSAIARHVGLRDREGASRAAGQSLFVMVAFSLLLSLILVPLASPLMHAFGEPQAAEAAVAYGMPMFVGAFFLISASMMSGILRGEGAAKASMTIQVAGAVSNMVLDPVLMYGFGMGVAGAGWATMLAGAVTLLHGSSQDVRVSPPA